MAWIKYTCGLLKEYYTEDGTLKSDLKILLKPIHRFPKYCFKPNASSGLAVDSTDADGCSALGIEGTLIVPLGGCT